MVNKLILGLITVGLFTFSCQKDENRGPDQIETSRVQVKNNNFDDRITYHDEPVESTGKTSNTNAQFTYVADVTSPVINGATLSASGIDFQGNRAYVSYHWNGSPGDYAGAIEVIDVSQPSQPRLLNGVYFTDTDLNELYVQGNKVYAVGGRSLSSSGYDQNSTDGAVVEVIRLQGGLLTNQTDEAALPSYSGNSVFKKGNDLYVTSGNTGGGAFEVSLKNNQYLDVTKSDYYSNSKFGVDEGSMFVFLEGGSSSKLHIHNSNNFNPNNKTTINLSSPQAPLDGKGVLDVDFSNKLAYVSSGSYGLNVYDLKSMSGNAIQSFNPAGNGLVNGTSHDNDYVYAAKGSDGLYILQKDSFTVKGIFAFNGSANYVRSNGQNVFIANGKSGLKILANNGNINFSNPYCTNQTRYENYNGGNGIVRLTAMGHYLENGNYGKRWRIRNETNTQKTVYWKIYGSSLSGQFTVNAKTAVHFTSHYTNNTSGGGTMILFSDQAMTNQIQVKAHGGSVNNLSNCN